MASTIFISDDFETSPFLNSKIVPAADYIRAAPADFAPGTVVMNVGDDHSYLTTGYYVSLLAEARGHRPVPATRDILAWGVKRAGAEADWRSALLHFPDRSSGLPFHHVRPEKSAPKVRARPGVDRYSLGVLATEGEPLGASSARSIEDFAHVAASHGLDVVRLGKTQIEDVDTIDALFIRDLTTPLSHAYQFSRRAADLGIPVIDDPASIIRCSNKVFVYERLRRDGISTPRALVMTPDVPIEHAVEQLGLPLVLKIPNGSFCIGVHKVCSRADGERLLAEMRRSHPVLIAQEYLPTEFDWRIGILDGTPLFACKYYMARGHWQVIKYTGTQVPEAGEVAAVPLADVPPALLACACRAGAAMGNGLYGIDIKEHAGAYYVIEVNDNPDIDSGFEVSRPEWARLAQWFRTGIETARRADARPRSLSA